MGIRGHAYTGILPHPGGPPDDVEEITTSAREKMCRDEATRAERIRKSGEPQKANPYHCAVCRSLIEPGKPGGVPGNALGFPSVETGGSAHCVRDGSSVLWVLAQKKLPHHVHGRGSRHSLPLMATLAHAVPRCKPFLTVVAPTGRFPPYPCSCLAMRRHFRGAATPQYRRSARELPVPADEPPRRS
jgi:hypothetical protein